MTIDSKLTAGELAAKLQDAWHYAAFAAGRETSFSERDIVNSGDRLNRCPQRKPTARQLAVEALLRAGQCAVQAGTPGVAVGTAAAWTHSKVKHEAQNLLAAIEAFGAAHLIDARRGRTYLDLLSESEGYFARIARAQLVAAVHAAEPVVELKTTKIATETVCANHVVVSKSGMQLKVHALVGMPGDRVILGHRLDNTAKGQNEAWPVLDLEFVRVLSAGS